MKKDNRELYEAFRDKGASLFVGFLCLVYFVLFYFSQLGPLAKILPPYHSRIFILIAVLILVVQCVVWKMLRLFHARWYRSVFSTLLFLSEFMISYFSITFLSWPFYLLGAYLFHQAHKVY